MLELRVPYLASAARPIYRRDGMQLPRRSPSTAMLPRYQRFRRCDYAGGRPAIFRRQSRRRHAALPEGVHPRVRRRTSGREFAAFVQRTAKCNVCHQGTKDRKNLNPYGEELAKLLDYHTDNHDVAKIAAALETVADMPPDPSRPDGPTYGERIAEADLPAGDLEKMKREPWMIESRFIAAAMGGLWKVQFRR